MHCLCAVSRLCRTMFWVGESRGAFSSAALKRMTACSALPCCKSVTPTSTCCLIHRSSWCSCAEADTSIELFGDKLTSKGIMCRSTPSRPVALPGWLQRSKVRSSAASLRSSGVATCCGSERIRRQRTSTLQQIIRHSNTTRRPHNLVDGTRGYFDVLWQPIGRPGAAPSIFRLGVPKPREFEKAPLGTTLRASTARSPQSQAGANVRTCRAGVCGSRLFINNSDF